MSRHDKRDPSRAVMILTRAIHHLFRINRKSGLTGNEQSANLEALEILFEAKRKVKAQEKAAASASFLRFIAKEVRQ